VLKTENRKEEGGCSFYKGRRRKHKNRKTNGALIGYDSATVNAGDYEIDT